MSTISREGEAPHSTPSTTQDSTRSKPSSLITDEDWDQLLAKDQQENSSDVTIKKCFSSTDLESICPLKVVGEVEEIKYASPIKVGRNSGQYSTPSSPSEIIRLTRKNPAAVDADQHGSKVEEAAQFEKELGDWINNEYSPFEGGGDTLKVLKN